MVTEGGPCNCLEHQSMLSRGELECGMAAIDPTIVGSSSEC